MKVDIKPLEGLKRAVEITVPADILEASYEKKLKRVAKSAKIDGFRPGKVPQKVLEKRFGESILHEAAGELMDEYYKKALEETKLKVASSPEAAEQADIARNQPFTFTVTVDVFPDIDIQAIELSSLPHYVSTVSDEDKSTMLLDIQKQHATWAAVEREAQSGDKVTIDFEGFLGEEAFEGGSSTDFELELGSNSMIPGFEDGIAGMKIGDEKRIKATFPKDYHAENLAGKEAEFNIVLKSVQASSLPELTDEFVQKLGIKEGGLEQLNKQIAEGMGAELKQAVTDLNKQVVFDALIDANNIEVPQAAVDREIEALQNQSRQRMMEQFKHMKELDVSKFPLPKEPFIEEATRRVKLGLLLSEIIESNELKPDNALVKQKIADMCASYPEPEEAEKMYYTNPQFVQQIEAVVLEEQAMAKVTEGLTFADEDLSYQEAMKRASENKKGM